MASSIVELDYALRARLGLVLAALVVFPGTWLVMVLGDSPGTLFHQRMAATPVVFGVPLLAWAVFRVCRAPAVTIQGQLLSGTTPAGARFRWDLRQTSRFSTGQRFGVPFVQRSLPEASRGRGLKRIYLSAQSVELVTAAIADNEPDAAD